MRSSTHHLPRAPRAPRAPGHDLRHRVVKKDSLLGCSRRLCRGVIGGTLSALVLTGCTIIAQPYDEAMFDTLFERAVAANGAPTDTNASGAHTTDIALAQGQEQASASAALSTEEDFAAALIGEDSLMPSPGYNADITEIIEANLLGEDFGAPPEAMEGNVVTGSSSKSEPTQVAALTQQMDELVALPPRSRRADIVRKANQKNAPATKAKTVNATEEGKTSPSPSSKSEHGEQTAQVTAALEASTAAAAGASGGESGEQIVASAIYPGVPLPTLPKGTYYLSLAPTIVAKVGTNEIPTTATNKTDKSAAANAAAQGEQSKVVAQANAAEAAKAADNSGAQVVVTALVPDSTRSEQAVSESNELLAEAADLALASANRSTDQNVAASSSPSSFSPAANRAKSRFIAPLSGKIIANFGFNRNGWHNDGINIAARGGTSVRAIGEGTVIYAGDDLTGFGNLILVRHAEDYVSAYAHADEVKVTQGQQVTQGEIIATVGSTGSVTSPQLHFEIRRGTQPINPITYLSSASEGSLG